MLRGLCVQQCSSIFDASPRLFGRELHIQTPIQNKGKQGIKMDNVTISKVWSAYWR